jgi:hypothetical protein
MRKEESEHSIRYSRMLDLENSQSVAFLEIMHKESRQL